MTYREYNELKEVIRWVVGQGSILASDLQLKFIKGYNWADKKLASLEELKIVGENRYLFGRKVIVNKNEAETIILNQVKYK